MLTGNSEGSIAVWNLNEQMLIGQKTGAHSGPVVSMHSMLGQPYVLTSGTDNRMVKWILKNELALPEVHTELEGHAEPVGNAFSHWVHPTSLGDLREVLQRVLGAIRRTRRMCAAICSVPCGHHATHRACARG